LKIFISNAIMKIPFLASFLTIAIFIVPSSFAQVSQLLMFDDDDCSWCRKWDSEIGVIYKLTTESCQASLHQVKIGKALPNSVSINDPINYTPTFVLVHENKEVGRIVGYPGEEFFWSMLNEMIEENIPQQVQDANLANCKNT